MEKQISVCFGLVWGLFTPLIATVKEDNSSWGTMSSQHNLTKRGATHKCTMVE